MRHNLEAIIGTLTHDENYELAQVALLNLTDEQKIQLLVDDLAADAAVRDEVADRLGILE